MYMFITIRFLKIDDSGSIRYFTYIVKHLFPTLVLSRSGNKGQGIMPLSAQESSPSGEKIYI